MGLVTATGTLTQTQIDQAEGMIAAYLGMPTLSESTLVNHGQLGVSRLVHTNCPVMAVNSLELNGVAVTPVIVSLRAVATDPPQKLAYGNPWGAGHHPTRYVIQYVSGWTAATLPEPLQAAVLKQAEALALFEERNGITAERMGPVARNYAPVDLKNPAVDSLLLPWKAPCY